MKIMLHGADSGSNFGDILFAQLFYDHCISVGFEAVDFLQFPKCGVGAFCRKQLGYDRKVPFKEALKYDGLVLISGGYFGEDKRSMKDKLKRLYRYILPALCFVMKNKPIYILGVGGGPLISPFLRKSAVSIWNHATYITVRDEETKKYFTEYGVQKMIHVNSDTAQVICPEMVPEFIDTDALRSVTNSPKLMFIHLVNIKDRDGRFAKVVVPAINRFIREHSEYGVAVSTDWLCDKEKVLNLETVKALETKHLYIHIYHDSWQLCSLLNLADVVITMKLHVGIVSAALGKSVISFPAHREKVQRYYRQIGEEGRSIHITKLTEEIAYEQINKYADRPIQLSEKYRDMAQKNLDYLDQILECNMHENEIVGGSIRNEEEKSTD